MYRLRMLHITPQLPRFFHSDLLFLSKHESNNHNFVTKSCQHLVLPRWHAMRQCCWHRQLVPDRWPRKGRARRQRGIWSESYLWSKQGRTVMRSFQKTYNQRQNVMKWLREYRLMGLMYMLSMICSYTCTSARNLLVGIRMQPFIKILKWLDNNHIFACYIEILGLISLKMKTHFIKTKNHKHLWVFIRYRYKN